MKRENGPGRSTESDKNVGSEDKEPDGIRNWSDARVAEEARLESVYTPKAYPEFESRSLRKKNPAGNFASGIFFYLYDDKADIIYNSWL